MATGAARQEVPSDVELVADQHSPHGEGPVWFAQEGVLRWLDISGGLIYRYDPASGTNITEVNAGQAVGAIAPRIAGGLVLAVREGFATLEPGANRVELIVPVKRDKPDLRMNDGKCDRAGRFWAGTMADDVTPGAGAFYRLSPDRQVQTMLTGVTISNGVCWTQDDRTMYYIDSITHGVDAFDFDLEGGTISNRRRVVTIEQEGVLLDGMTIDAEGYLWVALWGGWAVHRYSPDGQLDRVVRVPAAHTSCPTFGGPDLGDLYISTAAMGFSPEEAARQPHAGGLFRCRPGVTGFPPYAFQG